MKILIYGKNYSKNNLIDYSSENILNYYFSYSGKMDPIITEYLNNNPDEIQFEYEVIKENFGEELSKFFYGYY